KDARARPQAIQPPRLLASYRGLRKARDQKGGAGTGQESTPKEGAGREMNGLSNDIDRKKLRREVIFRRTKRGLIQADVARETSISNSTIARIEDESHSKESLDRDSLMRICSWLRMPPDAFVTANAGKIVHYPDAPTVDKI